MFNLERAIKDWRRQVAAQGLQASEVLDELESHLRDEIEKQLQSGANEQLAYQAARTSIGEASVLKAEFAKLTANNRRARFLRSCYAVFATCMFFINAWTLLEYEMSPLQRASGFTAISLLCLYVACLPYVLKSFAASTYGQLAKVIKLVSCLLWLWPFYALLEALHIVHFGIGIVPTMVLWCFYAALAMTVCALVLNRHGYPFGGAGGYTPPPQPRPHPIPPCPPLPSEFGASLLPSRTVDPVVRQSLEAAYHEANRLGHDFIGTEHVLLGLLQGAKGVFANILGKMEIDPESVRGEIERLVCPTSPHGRKATLRFTPRANKAVTLAAREAKSLNHSCIMPEHVFLGLLLEGGGVAALVLRELGIDTQRTREAILWEVHKHDIV